jgi:Fe-S-cluster containining protein
MQNPDSFDRIVTYFHALARSPFTFKGQVYQPYQKFVVSDKVFRSYTCPEGCGACCMRCSLVWDQPNPYATDKVVHNINGVDKEFYVDPQADHQSRYCKHLSDTGRCGIYLHRPLPCRIELFKFVHTADLSVARAQVRLPGRGWNLTRVDGEKGAKCELTPYDPAMTETHIRDIRILKEWMDEFKIENDCKLLLGYLNTGPHDVPLTLARKGKRACLFQ